MLDPGLASLFPVTTTSPDETRALGSLLATHLRPGAVVGLYGDLGAGKTQLVKGICSGFGYEPGDVHSPTFTIVNEYETGHFNIYHFDAYRVERVEEFYDLGYEEYFFGDGLCLVEWANRVETLLPRDCVRIRLLHDGETRRRIQLTQHDHR